MGTAHGVRGSRPTDDDAEVECVVCRQSLSVSAFDPVRMEMWRRNRDISKKAKCKSCYAKLPERRSNAPKHTWKQSLYKCSVCNSALPAFKFDTGKLKQWEDTSTLYLARCGNCDTDMKTNAQTMTCNLCLQRKPADAFSPSRQRARASQTRRCKACDFPPCSSCGCIPTLPKETPYMCPGCLFPPCACGAPRPPYSQNRVTKQPTWQCEACRQ